MSDGGGRRIGFSWDGEQWRAVEEEQPTADDNSWLVDLELARRGDFVGPVAIEFSNLPSGVSVANPGTIPAGDELKNFTLTVGADAALVEGHQVTVTASAKDLRVKQIFEVDVHGS